MQDWDGDLKANWKVEAGHLVRTMTQPTEDYVLNQLSEQRKNEGIFRPLSFMGLELTIPKLHYYRLIRKYPELNAPDSKTRHNAWMRFFGSSEADPYRVRPRSLARG